jgi:exodeoxyribonuclease VIII
MRDVMLDLETMGNGPDSAITAIGAVCFDPVGGTVGAGFYRVVDLASSVASGGVMDPATVLWWMQQSDAARAEFARPGCALAPTLVNFRSWLLSQAGKDVLVWGNGAAFDNVVLAGAYRRAGLPVPWSYKNDRCYRTVAALAPQVARPEVGERHNAADDAEAQARHLIEVWRVLGLAG